MRGTPALILALVLLALPASAAAAEFTHEGLPIEETTAVALTGTNFGFVTGDGSGINCPDVEVELDLLPGGVGEITTFDTATYCTVIGVGLLTHMEPIDIHDWTAEADPENKRIVLGNVHLTNTITVGGQVAAENTFEGHEIWLNVDSNAPISTAELDNPAGGMTFNGANVDFGAVFHVLNGTEIGQE